MLNNFINMLIKEYGINDSQQVFTNECMEELDKFGKKYGLQEIFHTTANEIDCEGNNILDFLYSLNLEELKDNNLKEILKYLIKKMEDNKNQLPSELIKEYFKINTNLD